MAINKKILSDAIITMLNSGQRANPEMINAVLGDAAQANLEQQIADGISREQALENIAEEFEKEMTGADLTDIFLHTALLNEKADKTPQDFNPLIRNLKKKFLMNTNSENLLKLAISKRDEQYVDKPQVSNSELEKLISEFDTRQQITLAERLDRAYAVYQKIGDDSSATADRGRVVKFMEAVLNIKGEEKIQVAMNERIKKRDIEPDFIPNRKPSNLTKLPEAQSKKNFRFQRAAHHALALERGNIAKVREAGLQSDIELSTIMLQPNEREKHQIIIHDGNFLARQADNTFEKFDTRLHISHSKIDFMAFTTNLAGEIDVFDHLDQLDNIAHSSMNSQYAILCSGEFKITDGKLETMTAHSGHYEPDEQNIFMFLKYLTEQGVDISGVNVMLWKPLAHNDDGSIEDPSLTTEEVPHYYNAKELYDKWMKAEGKKENVVLYPAATTDQILSMLETMSEAKNKATTPSPAQPNKSEKPQAAEPQKFAPPARQEENHDVKAETPSIPRRSR